MNFSVNSPGRKDLDAARKPAHRASGTLVGIACYVLWYVLLSHFHPSPLADETRHQGAITQVLRGHFDPSGPFMLPGYHLIIAAGSALAGSSLSFSRLLTCLMCCVTVVLYASIPQRRHGRGSGRSPLLLVFLPILFPYTAMVYTDAVALLFIIGAIWSHTRRLPILPALLMFLACLIRQSNMVWVVFMAAWRALEVWDECESEVISAGWSRWNTFIRRLVLQVSGYVVVLGLVGIVLLLHGGAVASDAPENRPQPNVGNFYTISFFALILWAPIWLERGRQDVRSLVLAARMKPLQTGGMLLVVALLGAALITTFDNWHPWNQHLWYLRNIPIMLMERYMSFRVLGVACLFVAVCLIARFWSSQPNRGCLMLLALFTILFLLPHPLVEPRYFIVPFVLADIFVSYSDTQARRLTIWYGSISVVAGALIVSGRAMW